LAIEEDRGFHRSAKEKKYLQMMRKEEGYRQKKRGGKAKREAGLMCCVWRWVLVCFS
jgi:hypothetical protein